MASETKGSAFKIWIHDNDLAVLRRVSESTDTTQADLARRIVAAGLRCIEGNGDRFELPLEFRFPVALGAELKGTRPARSRR